MSSFDTYVFLTDQPIGRKEDKAGKLAYELRQENRSMLNYRLRRVGMVMWFICLLVVFLGIYALSTFVRLQAYDSSGDLITLIGPNPSLPLWLRMPMLLMYIATIIMCVVKLAEEGRNLFMSFWLGGIVWRYRHEGVYNIRMSDAGSLWLKMPGAAPSFKLELGDRDNELKKFIMSEIHYNVDLRQALAGFAATLGRDREGCLRNLHIAYKRFLEDRRIKHPQLWDFDESSSSL